MAHTLLEKLNKTLRVLGDDISLEREKMKDNDDNLARGLGDTLAKVINKTTGIKPCEGCNKRKATLNRWFPYIEKDLNT